MFGKIFDYLVSLEAKNNPYLETIHISQPIPRFLCSMKYMEIDFHFIREIVRQGLLDARIISLKDRITYAFTYHYFL